MTDSLPSSILCSAFGFPSEGALFVNDLEDRRMFMLHLLANSIK